MEFSALFSSKYEDWLSCGAGRLYIVSFEFSSVDGKLQEGHSSPLGSPRLLLDNSAAADSCRSSCGVRSESVKNFSNLFFKGLEDDLDR